MAEVKKQMAPGSVAKIFGSWFLPEVRAICNLFDLSHRDYIEDNSFDVFTENGHKEFVAFNPS